MGEAVCVRVYGGSVLLSILSAILYFFLLDVARFSWAPSMHHHYRFAQYRQSYHVVSPIEYLLGIKDGSPTTYRQRIHPQLVPPSSRETGLFTQPQEAGRGL